MKFVSSRNPKVKILKYLEFFEVFKKYDKLRTSDQIITMMQADYGITSNTRVVDFNKI